MPRSGGEDSEDACSTVEYFVINFEPRQAAHEKRKLSGYVPNPLKGSEAEHRVTEFCCSTYFSSLMKFKWL